MSDEQHDPGLPSLTAEQLERIASMESSSRLQAPDGFPEFDEAAKWWLEQAALQRANDPARCNRGS